MLLTAFLTALLTPPSLNSRALTLITDVYKSVTYTPVPQIPNNVNSNIDLLFFFILKTAAPVKDNIIRLLPCQSFAIISCELNSVTESSKVLNTASEYNVIKVKHLTNLNKQS
jgi:hypothetical protein